MAAPPRGNRTRRLDWTAGEGLPRAQEKAVASGAAKAAAKAAAPSTSCVQMHTSSPFCTALVAYTSVRRAACASSRLALGCPETFPRHFHHERT